MVNKFFLVLKKIVKVSLFIYAYDSLFLFSNHMIPINILNVTLVSFFGVIAMFYLIIFSFM